MSESRNKREGWYAGKYCKLSSSHRVYQFRVRHCRVRSDYRRISKPRKIYLDEMEFGIVENFRLIKSPEL